MQSDAEKAPRVGIVGRFAQHIAINMLRFSKPPLLMNLPSSLKFILQSAHQVILLDEQRMAQTLDGESLMIVRDCQVWKRPFANQQKRPREYRMASLSLVESID